MNYNYTPFSSPFKVVCPYCGNRQSIQTAWQRCNNCQRGMVTSSATTFKAPSSNTWSTGVTHKKHQD